MRCKAWIIAALLTLLLAGCSTLRLSYSQGSTLAYWWLDGYVDFNREQRTQVRAALDGWFGWHRSTQLPEYAQALATLQLQVTDKVTPAQVCGQLQAWQQRFERAYEHALPAIAEQLRGFTPEQIAHFEQQQKKKLKDATDDHLQLDLADRRKAADQRVLDRAESAYGRLNAAQRQWLSVEMLASPYKPELWLAERAQRQQDSLRYLRQWQAERSDASTVQAGLRRLGQTMLVSPRAEYQAQADLLTQANCQLAASLHNSASAKQRQHLIDKLKGWESDALALAKP